MTLSDLSIQRPVLASVLSLLIAVAGVAALLALPVRELPDVDRPVVSISTAYLGASPETVEATITEPIEAEMNGIEGIEQITSTSYFGLSAINVEFEAGRDVDLAATDVANAVQRAVGELPEVAERPVIRKAGADSDPIIWINVQSDVYSPADLTDIADRMVQSRMQLLPGVARAIIGGERRYAMRIWLDPARMAALSVDALDVRRAIQESNLQLPAGEIEANTRKFTINANAQLETAEDYESIVLRETDDMPIRLRDIGWAELGSENYYTITRYSGRPVVGIGIVRQSRANELDIAAAVRREMEAIAPSLPEGVELSIATDSTIFVREALVEVWRTLAIAFGVVVLVNLFFLQSRTSTTVVSIVIPVSLVGAFAAMAALGFSLNILTLLALVLCIGLLVDDAIVVLENVYRHQEAGEGRLDAAIKGAREVTFPVIATSLAVIAVLVPLSLMSGDTGRLFREFAVTAAAAVTISTFVALSLVPMLCSRFLTVTSREGRIAAGINRGVGALLRGYDFVLKGALRYRAATGLLVLILMLAAGAIYQRLDQTFLPVEDRGQALILVRAPEGSTSAYTERALVQVEERLLATDEIAGFFAAIGMGMGRGDDTAVGRSFVRFKHWRDRDRKQQDVVESLVRPFLTIKEALVFIINRPSLGQSSTGDIEIVLTGSSASLEEMGELMDTILADARATGFFRLIDTDLRLANPQLDIAFDRERAADLGVPIRSIAESLRLLVSQGPADDFVLRNQQYDVVMALESPMRSVPEQLGEIHVRSQGGEMIPLSALIDPLPGIGPSTLNHYGLQRSASLNASLAPGVALAPALDRLDEILDQYVPEGYARELRGTAREYRESSQQILITFGLALVIIYLVLAAQFESFIHPLTVLFSVPLSTLGALAALWGLNALDAFELSLNLYSQIGMILLIGLVTKNAILLVDFANRRYAEGAELLVALADAGHTRFRPILMTSATSILGGLPLVFASGAGAESRQSIGVAVVGGLLFSTIFTLIVVPVVHYALVRTTERWFGGQPVPGSPRPAQAESA